MAVALDMSNEVLDVFSRLKRTEMTLIELHNHLALHINRMSMDEVLRLIRSPNLVNLFNLQTISHDLCLVQFTPKLTLCEGCLQKGCRNKGNCTKLHLCRHVSHFNNKPLEKICYFPHKLSDYPNNLVLLRRFNLDTLNEDLLLNLLRLHYSQFQSEYQNHRPHSNNTPNQSRSPSQLKKSPLPHENPTERQVDVSIPSERDASDVDLEIVQLLLAIKDVIVERILEKQISNEFYQRFTLQFPNKQILDGLLANNSIIVHNNISIKMKRTQRQRDTKLFALKFLTDQKIDNVRLNLYVETLVGKISSSLFDMTPDGNDEQIYLIRSEQSIDFDHLYRIHSAKNTLQGHRVMITEVYATEILEVSFASGSFRRSMTMEKLRQVIGEQRWEQEVFACLSIRNQQSAELELMNAEITAKWLAEANRFERDLSLLIRPVIDFIQSSEKIINEEEEEDEEITKLLSTSKLSLNDPPKEDNQTFAYTVKPDWRIVLTHPVFGDEYRKYIRENLHISVQINGSSIDVPNEQIRKELARYTNMFIQKFVFQEVTNPDKAQVRMIKENYSRMAHKWIKETNRTLVAARRETITELFPQTTRQPTRPLTTPTFRHKQSPIPKKQDQQSTPPPLLSAEPTPIRTTEDNLHVLQYSIENSVYIPFFNPSNSFPVRLSNYLSATFNIQLESKSITSSKIVLELKGQHQDVSDARPALTSLFSSLKTKIYSSTPESCQFSIPDFDRVAQWNLDRSSIVSSCSFSTKNGGILSVRYFSDNPQFGTDEEKLDDILLRQLCGRFYPVSINSVNLHKKLQEIEHRISKKTDYGKDICCFYDHQNESPSIRLGGIQSIVQQFYQEIQKIADQYASIVCRVRLQPIEIDYLLKICSDDLMKFEKEYENDSVDLRKRLKSEASEFLAPKYLHEKIKLFLMELTRIQTITADVQCSAQLIKQKKQEMTNLARKNRCLISITLSVSRPTVSTINSGAIHISNGDLSTETADVLVVCSSSGVLRAAMVKAAGLQVEQELTGKDLAKNIIDTSAGQLKQTKRLLFIPWTPPATYFASQDIHALRQSIAIFVQSAMKYTIQQKFNSIAFPAIGCGGFGVAPDVIATMMIDTVREQLTLHAAAQLRVIFVIQQANVLDVFKAKLKPSSTASGTRSPSPPGSSNPEKINIALTTSNANIDIAKKLLKAYEGMLNTE